MGRIHWFCLDGIRQACLRREVARIRRAEAPREMSRIGVWIANSISDKRIVGHSFALVISFALLP